MIPIQNQNLAEPERQRIHKAQLLMEKGSDGIYDLIEMLTDPSWVVRRTIVEALISLGIPAVQPLCDTLQSQRHHEGQIAAIVDTLVGMQVSVERSVTHLTQVQNPAVVADAAQIFGRRRSQSAIPILIYLTRHQNDNVAVAAIEALGRIGGRYAVEALIETIQSGSFFRTFPAIDILGRSGDPRGIEPLIGLLSQPTYLPEAARALGRSGQRTAALPLLHLFKSPSDSIIRIASASLWELRERYDDKSGGNGAVIDELIRDQMVPEAVRRLVRILTGSDESEAIGICRLLGVIGSSEATPVLANLLDGPPTVAQAAADALKKIGTSADDLLQKSIMEGGSQRRKVLLPILNRSSVAPIVAECLKDSDPEVRALACETLARLGNSEVVFQLFPLLGDENLRVIHAATAAIQALGSSEARELATQAITSENPAVRRAATRILSYFGDSAYIQPILDRLHDPDSRVREAALLGLPYMEDVRAFDALIEAAKSPDSRVRSLAMRALGQIPKPAERVYAILLKGLSDPDSWVRYYACQSVGRLAYLPALPEVTKLLHNETGHVRIAAVEALSHFDSEEAYETLIHAASSEDIEARRSALIGLGISPRLEALPVILSALSTGDIPTRLMALSAIVNFRSHRVLGALRRAATDADEQVSSAAIGFLAARPEQEATEALVELVSSESTRERARQALEIPGEGRTAGLLVALGSADDELAPLIISILSKGNRDAAKTALLSAMKLNNIAARKAAASGLAGRRDPEMIAALKEGAENDPDAEVRKICTILLYE